MTVQRVPRLRNQRTLDGSDMKFMGWEFICPGRLDALTGEPKGCGKRCTYLYAPQTVWTLGLAMGGSEGCEGFDVSDDAAAAHGSELPRLSGEWQPGVVDPIKAASGGGLRSFACKSCWGVRTAVMSHPSHGWNDFITQISGGLLSGCDVKRPLEEFPLVRRRRPNKLRKREAKSLLHDAETPAKRAAS